VESSSTANSKMAQHRAVVTIDDHIDWINNNQLVILYKRLLLFSACLHGTCIYFWISGTSRLVFYFLNFYRVTRLQKRLIYSTAILYVYRFLFIHIHWVQAAKHIINVLPPSQTGRWRHNVLSLSVRSFVRPFAC